MLLHRVCIHEKLEGLLLVMSSFCSAVIYRIMLLIKIFRVRVKAKALRNHK